MSNALMPHLPAAEVFALADAVELRTNRVMSLTAYRVGVDSVVVFSFDAGEGISQEVLEEDCLYWVLAGESVMDAGGRRLAMRGGDCFVVPAGAAHAMAMTTPTKVAALTVGWPQEGGRTMANGLMKNIEKGEVTGLNDLVAVEKNQVASVTLAQKDNLTVTVFAFDAGTGIGPHTSNGDAMVNAIDGEGEITIGADKFTVKAGQSIVMPAGIPHAVNARDKTFKMLLIVVKP